MAKHRVKIDSLESDALTNMPEQDLNKVTGGLLPANVYRTANKVQIGAHDTLNTGGNNIIAVLIGL